MAAIAPEQSKTPDGRLAILVDQVESVYRSQFATNSVFVAAAPGRVNLMGEHVDYNDGFVLPMAIERYVVIAAAPADEADRSFARFHSIANQETVEAPLDSGPGPALTGWGRYLEGVIAGFAKLGVSIPAFDAVIGSDIPVGAGLSSSAALEVATATILESLTQRILDPVEKAVLCRQAEHRYAKVPCGIMDQFSSVFGRPHELMLLDCRSQEVQSIPLKSHDVSVLITNSNVKHQLADGEYAARRLQCETALAKLIQSSWRDVTLEDVEAARGNLEPIEYACACHVVGESQRTLQTAEAFRDGDWVRVGELMLASHVSLRDLFAVSCRELDLLVELAQAAGIPAGVYGSRMTGGGFGGCTVSLVNNNNVEAVKNFLHMNYLSKTGIEPHSFVSQPASGAHLICVEQTEPEPNAPIATKIHPDSSEA